MVGPINGAPHSARFAITLIDYRSKWAEIALVPHVTTTNVISFFSAVWAREGYPIELVSDNGLQFTSHEFVQYLRQRDIRHTCSSAYWPRGNGAIERFNRTFKSWICGTLNDRFHDHVRLRLAHYRATPHCTTGQSPSAMLHGRHMRLDLPIVSSSYKRDIIVDQRVESQQLRNKKSYDNRYRTRTPDFEVGDYVHVQRQRKGGKMERRYSRPVKIEKRVGPASYRLSDGSTRNAAHLARSAIEDPEPEHHTPSITNDDGMPWDPDNDHEVSDAADGTDAPSDSTDSEASPRKDRELSPSRYGRKRWRPDRLQM